MAKEVFSGGLNDEEKAELKAVLKVAKQCNYESKHTRHVTQLALEIFDDLEDLHQLDTQARYYLLCAALLHDIGVHTEGPHGHHKTALNIILSTPLLKFNQKDRLIIGSIARYHRRALPSLEHDHFRALNPNEREIVCKLAGILRVADGLDYSHRSRIGHTRTDFNDGKITCQCYIRKEPVKKEIRSANKKSDLLSQTFNRKVKFKILQGEEFIGLS
jgi:exopolyphosphatase/guanosine-5'-triphosphate,3'-diphosphate pyrophosphatase